MEVKETKLQLFINSKGGKFPLGKNWWEHTIIHNSDGYYKMLSKTEGRLKDMNQEMFFNFLKWPSFQAWACETEVPTFAISQAASNIMKDIFTRMLAHPDIFPEIGKAKDEIINTPTLQNYAMDINTLNLACIGDAYTLPIPKDLERIRFARFLYGLAMDIFLLHEIGHYADGHLDFLKTNFNHEIIEEYESPLNAEIMLIRQTLEKDADSFAVVRYLRYLTIVNNDLKRVPQQIRHFYADIYELIGYLSFAMSSYYILSAINYYYLAERNLTKSTHPSPAIRTMHSLGLIEAYFKYDEFKLDTSKIADTVSQNIAKSIEAYQKICVNPLNVFPYGQNFQILSDAELLQAIEIEKCWNNIRDELETYSYLPVADKTQ